MDPNAALSTAALETPSLDTGSVDQTYKVLDNNATTEPSDQKKEYLSTASFLQSAFEDDHYLQIVNDFVYDIVMALDNFPDDASAYDQQYYELISRSKFEDFFDYVLEHRYGTPALNWTYEEKQATVLADQRLRDLLANDLASFGESYFSKLLTVYLINTTAKERHGALVYLFEVPMPNGEVYHRYTIETIIGIEGSGDAGDALALLGVAAAGSGGAAAGSAAGPGGTAGGGLLGLGAGATAATVIKTLTYTDVGINATFVRIRYETIASNGVGGYDESAEPAYEFSWEVSSLMVKGFGSAGISADFNFLPGSVNIITPGSVEDNINSTTLYSNEYLPPSFFAYSVFWEASGLSMGGSVGFANGSVTTDELSTLGIYNFELEKMLNGSAGGMNISTGLDNAVAFDINIFDGSIGAMIPIERIFDTAITEIQVEQLQEVKEGDIFAMNAVIGFPTNGTTLSADDIRVINKVVWQMLSLAMENNGDWPGYTVSINGSHSMLGGEGDTNTWLAKDRAQAVFDAFMRIMHSAEYHLIYDTYFPDYLDYVFIETPGYIRPSTSKPTFDNSAIDRIAYIQVKSTGY